MTTLEEKKLERRVEDLERQVDAALTLVSALFDRIEKLEDKANGAHH